MPISLTASHLWLRNSILLLVAVLLLSACATRGGQTDDPGIDRVEDSPELAAPVVPEETLLDALDQVPQQQTAPLEPRFEDLWARMRAGMALNACQQDESGRRWAQWYADHPDYMDRTFTRAAPWLEFIVSEVEQRDQPMELALLPVVESAFDPFAYSSASAVGAWQFIASTGRMYDLEQDWWHDGRRDVVASTHAALDHLQDLHDALHDDWLLALAAYNSGQGRVTRAVARAGSQDFFKLRLPRETRGYVPKLLGISCLIAEPERFDFELPGMPDEPQLTILELDEQADLVMAAQLAEMPVAELFALNPGYNRWATTPSGPHRLVLPPEHAENLVSALETRPDGLLMQWDQITVRSGDSLSKLASVHDVPLSVIRRVNQLNTDTIRPGQKMRLPRGDLNRPDPLYVAAADELARLQTRLIAPDKTRYRVRRGDTLGSIAQRFGVSSRNIQRWNGISNPRRLQIGQRLDIYQSPASRGTQKAVNHIVQQGDSLWKIARKYRVKVSDLRRWNNLSNRAILRPGQSLKVTL